MRCTQCFPITLSLLVVAFVYVRGWIRLRRNLTDLVPASRLVYFLAGLIVLWVASASRLSTLDHELLTGHMLQHLLLMTVAAPLILMGAPVITLLHGVSRRFARGALAATHFMGIRQLSRAAAHPVICWLAGTVTVIFWHIPRLFELGMMSDTWHAVEQASFLGAGLLFWWPIVEPWPTIASYPHWAWPIYLFLAMLPCDALSAFLTFCDRVVYPAYAPDRRFDLSALQDQQWAGALMWVWVTFAYMLPAALITIRLLYPQSVLRAEGSARIQNTRPLDL